MAVYGTVVARTLSVQMIVCLTRGIHGQSFGSGLPTKRSLALHTSTVALDPIREDGDRRSMTTA